MTSPRRAPRAHPCPRPLLLALLCGLLLGVLAPLTAPPGAVAHHGGAAPGPINAGNTYGWWHHDGVRWMEHWETNAKLPGYWNVAGRGIVQHQHGMLTLNTTERGSVSATRMKRGHRYGRWEIRLRTRRYQTAGADYRVLTELIPRDRKARACGSRNIALEQLTPDSRNARLYARSRSGSEFAATLPVDSRNQNWHTFAVEVRPHRVAWFVDAHVVRVEKRAGSVSGVPLVVRFTMLADGEKKMNKSRMQMDWMRHFNLNGPNEKPVKAKATAATDYRKAC